MLFRLRCHFCGARSKYSKGTTEFQCQDCEAWNFFDRKGEVVDAPARVVAAPRAQPVPVQPSQTFAHPGASSSNFNPPDQNQIFCQTCLTNQRIVTESVASYLPDEDDPLYPQYERNLSTYKANMEEQYPQICKKCAPKVQATIARADRYGLQQNVAKNMRDTARRGRPNKGQRDDWGKWSTRMILHSLGWMLYASLLVQAAWHAYSLLTTIFTTRETLSIDVDSLGMDDLAFDPTLSDCAKESVRLRFYKPCADLLSSMMPRALWTSFLLIWYSPGLALWYHHTIRVESVHGRGQYLLMQLTLLVVRSVAWVNLSNTSVTSGFTKPQLLAAHGFMAAFVPLLQKYSERVVRYDAWRIRGKMMRSPEETDVFSASAGPSRDTSAPQASSIPPTRLFDRNYKPFPIESLAPRAIHRDRNPNLPCQPPPSPPDSQSVSDDEMEYQMEWQPSAKPQMPGAPNNATYQPRTSRSNSDYNYGMTQSKGWTPMRDELFGIHSQQTAEEQRRREEAEQARLREQEFRNRSPFRGTLPPDPMQRRLRGVQPPVQKKEQPMTERSDFYERMSKSFGSQRFGAQTPAKIGNLERRAGAASTTKKNVKFADTMAGGLSLNDDDEDFSPVKSRAGRKASAAVSGSGSLNLREGQWRLPDKTEATGLEDLFGGRSFRINDEPAGVESARRATRAKGTSTASGSWPWGKTILFGLSVAMLAVGWNVVPVRRAVCFWLVEKLEAMGY